MHTWIALLRGINIGGNHLLPMKQLTALLEQNDCRDVKTYIQSGNVVLRSPEADADALGQRITAAIAASHGFAPRVLLLSRDEFAAAAAANPFAAVADPKTVHLFFLAAPSTAAPAAFAAHTTSERHALHPRCFYLHTPDGFGKSKLAERAERLLGVPATARNLRTVGTLLDLARTYA